MPKVTKIQQPQSVIQPRVKVAAYARVSKDTEQLMHSLSAQVSYYSDLIQRTPDWEYAGVYVDAGITGTSAAARPEFQRMIADCEAGKIDIVLTKSISRFARNTVDLLTTVRHLKELGVEVRFEKENISSLSGDGEVMLSILASFAQEESTSLSNNIKWTFQKKFKNGDVHSHHRMLGYRWEGDKRLVVQEEAETVRFIFDSYLAGKSCGQIAGELRAMGVKSLRGRPFPKESVVTILRNREYTGCLLMQTNYNYQPKKRKINYGELPIFCIDDHHEAIVSPETFEAAQAMKEKRGLEAARDPRFQSDFKSLVWCGKCGCKASWHRSPQARERGDMSSVIWTCNVRNRRGGCDCKNIQDREIHRAAENLGIEIDKIERIEMFDEKLIFTKKTGQKKVWRR